ncbi:unnamed protein product [Rhodiola kirilowii]
MATTITKNHRPANAEQQHYDQASQLKAFEDSKLGVKGIADSRLPTIPSIFIHPKTTQLITSTTSSTIPIIDLQGGLHHANKLALRDNIVQQVKDAAESWSIFRVVNHWIKQSLLDEVIAGAKGFHEQDDEIKKVFYSRDSAKRVAFSSNYNIFSGRPLDWRDTLSCLVAPHLPIYDLPAICRQSFIEYTNEVRKLGLTLFELLSGALGLKNTHLEEMGCAERLCILGNYYPPCPQPELTLGASSHADSGFLTVLLQDQVKGLQLLRNGKWLDVPPVAGSLIINMGYLMQLITNDKFKSVTHRVVAPKESRVSVAALFRTHYDRGDDKQVFGPIKKLISDENPLRYRDVSVEEYVKCLYEKPAELSSVLDCFRL